MKDLAGIAANLVGAEVAKGAVIGAAVGVALNPNQGDIIRSIAVGAGLGVALAWGANSMLKSASKDEPSRTLSSVDGGATEPV